MNEPGEIEGARLEPTSLVFRPISQHYAPSWFEIVSLIKAPDRGFQTQAEAPGGPGQQLYSNFAVSRSQASD